MREATRADRRARRRRGEQEADRDGELGQHGLALLVRVDGREREPHRVKIRQRLAKEGLRLDEVDEARPRRELHVGEVAVEAQEADEIDDEGPVIIAGIGRFGQIVNRLVQSSGVRTVVLDHDMRTIELMRRFGFRPGLRSRACTSG